MSKSGFSIDKAPPHALLAGDLMTSPNSRPHSKHLACALAMKYPLI